MSAVALTRAGSVFAWGKNDYGQLGTGDTKAQVCYNSNRSGLTQNDTRARILRLSRV